MKIEVKETTSEKEIEWQNWYDEDTFSIEAEKVIFSEERMAFYLINETNGTGTTVYAAHHENSKYKDSTPHGIRLANAICRLLSLTGEIETESMIDGINAIIEENGHITVNVNKTAKGVLWTCA